MRAITKIVKKHHRIIPAVREHIKAEQSLTGGNIAVRIDESSRHRIIISAVQIIQSRLRVIVISSVAKRIKSRACRSTTVGIHSREYISPSVIGIGYQPVPVLVVDIQNISLYIFTEQVAVKKALQVG